MMTTLTRIKLILALIGIATWGYGVRIDHRPVQWVGVALLAIALLLRFMFRRESPPRR